MSASPTDSGRPAEVHLFVYGTLRHGESAGTLMAGCRRLGPASLRGTLYDVNGRFPALVLEGDGEVGGEVWACPEDRLARLDAYEGVPAGLYRRVRVRVEGRDCWTYVAGPRLRLGPGMVIPGGRWEPPAR